MPLNLPLRLNTTSTPQISTSGIGCDIDRIFDVDRWSRGGWGRDGDGGHGGQEGSAFAHRVTVAATRFHVIVAST